MISKEDMVRFEDHIAEEFNAGKIPYPIHLSEGNEDQLREIFKDIKPVDWIFGSWRLHYHALLKGVPRSDLRAAIYRGESMALSFPDYKVFGSAIVGGIVPIALGVAMSIAREGRKEQVWVFSGDMTAETGIYHECFKFAGNQALPINFIVEDNGVSVCTDTDDAWGPWGNIPNGYRYTYRSKWPHAGAGERVQF